MFYCNSKTKASGSAIYVADRITCRQINKIKIKDNFCEDVWIKIGLDKNETLIVGSIYTQRITSNVFKMHTMYIHVLKSFKPSQKFSTLGDFNINYDKTDNLHNILSYANHLHSVGCVQLINKPTRITTTSSSTIDHIYTSSALINQVTPTIICDDISDHLPVCAEFKCKLSHSLTSRPVIRRLTRENIDLFLEDLDNSLYSSDMRGIDVNELLTIMNNLTNRHFPKKMLSRKQFKILKNPWISPEILASIKQKNKIYVKYLKTKCPKQLQIYKKIRNKVTHEKEAAKRAYFETLCRNASNSADTWKLVNKILRNKRPKVDTLNLLRANENLVSNSQEICNAMNKHFVEVGEKLSAKVPVDANHESMYKQFLGKRQSSSIVLQTTNENEVIEIISGLNSSKSSGYIGIPTVLFKESKFIIARHLAIAFNDCLSNGTYPNILKIAKVIPLHKGRSKLERGNYRPISILSPVNKVFETLLHKRFIDFWDKYNLFNDSQFGFRNNHSTNLALTCLHESILQQRDGSNLVCGIFLDFAKAFDCVNHRILLDKLEHYGVRGHAHSLLKSYLSNRMQYTINNDQSSSMLPITIGVPQGSVLGPFLFLVYINDLPNSCDSKVILYADDAALICADKTYQGLKMISESEIHNVENWIISNKLTLNYSKTNCVLFSKQAKNISSDNFCIRARNGIISELSVVKYLDVYIDNKLSWEMHAQSLVKKLAISRGIISKLRYYAAISILKCVYFSFVYSHLQYGVSTWGNSAAKYINKIQVQQNCIIKIISKVSFCKTKLLPLYNELK